MTQRINKTINRMRKAVVRDILRRHVRENKRLVAMAQKVGHLTTFDGIFKALKTRSDMPIKSKYKSPGVFEITRSTSGEWFWRFLASNGKEIARQSETVKQRRTVRRAIAIMQGASGAVVRESVAIKKHVRVK